MLNSKNYYKILGVSTDADDFIINAAYRALIQRYQPDEYTGKLSDSEDKIQDINEAYYILSDTINRVKYDNDIDLQTINQINETEDQERFDKNLYNPVKDDNIKFIFVYEYIINFVKENFAAIAILVALFYVIFGFDSCSNSHSNQSSSTKETADTVRTVSLPPIYSDQETINLIKEHINTSFVGSEKLGFDKVFEVSIDSIIVNQQTVNPDKYFCSAHVKLLPLITINNICEKIINEDPVTIKQFNEFLSRDDEAKTLYDSMQSQYDQKIEAIKKQGGNEFLQGLVTGNANRVLNGLVMGSDIDKAMVREPIPLYIISQSYDLIPKDFKINYYATLVNKENIGASHYVAINGFPVVKDAPSILMRFLVYHESHPMLKSQIQTINKKTNRPILRVASEKAYFYDKPNGTVKTSYLVTGNIINIYKESNGFVYTVFVDNAGDTRKGWLRLKDLASILNISTE